MALRYNRNTTEGLVKNENETRCKPDLGDNVYVVAKLWKGDIAIYFRDFAILLNSGMSLKKALLFNFLSACTCFLGLVFGILLGGMTGAHHYVFGVAGGMFLYISLADMMPEMNAVEITNDKSFGTVTIFILQNLGLLSGYSVMLVMAVYGSEIKF
ncbi:metal cation symporter ZIP14-like [Gigantopelta aegis]|uniref:metal cation symporter ZIP14-like n=1 Tax=Gigantopelta aegis TaxID=1735272 RepID=UPI001B88C3BD|nr:metal cation symporter ZIP14-like [Gigantopelta aegis]